ncbi:hypothetical protein FGM00_14915 [Aggregatimonas sangjinii]|uniref:Uncharacterized protein n=1 Tax=Aggregatimonas sangjinii TaxID=2583587 RepID=A0A5B7SS42_9FLAO|nr:hypothetical protein [Aggregatimonas sangjinii]QCX01337.1 hypothetical protein FGM00_14915 [Aggregatimonas sangjinii]
MNLKNFTIESSFTEISYGDIWIDLHNDYLWTETINDSKSIKLFYEKREAEWVNEAAPVWFCIKIDGVKGVWTKENDNDYPIEHLENDKNTPDLFGFGYSGNEIMDEPTDFKKSSEELEALIFTFVTGRTLKISGQTAEIIELKNFN